MHNRMDNSTDQVLASGAIEQKPSVIQYCLVHRPIVNSEHPTAAGLSQALLTTALQKKFLCNFVLKLGKLVLKHELCFSKHMRRTAYAVHNVKRG